MASPHILIADLNNFARYPTLSVGYLAAICRQTGHSVRVFSPLSIGVRGFERERPATWISLLSEKLNFALAQNRYSVLRSAREWVGANLTSSLSRHTRKVAASFEREIESQRPDLVFLSTYLMYRPLVEVLSGICKKSGIPVLLGGPYFAQSEVIRDWVAIPGVTALAAGEVEDRLPKIIESVLCGDDVAKWEGIIVADADLGFRGSIARPLRTLNELPHPDFRDFPWSQYPEKIVPVLAGRGCAWGVCTFCSDVTGTAGRTFRSRSPERVLDEIRSQYETHGVNLFVFTDMKLNGKLDVWHSLIEKFQDVVPGGRWIASVHVGAHGDSGLSATELRAAALAGCVRLTTGLESGSQRVLDQMKKGTRIEQVSEYLRAASEAKISTRATMIAGYPGELADDVRASADFVRNHLEVIERIKLCSFSRTVGTTIDRQLSKETSHTFGRTPNGRKRHSEDAEEVRRSAGAAKIDHLSLGVTSRPYQREMSNLIEIVHRVNQRPLPKRASVFEGVM